MAAVPRTKRFLELLPRVPAADDTVGGGGGCKAESKKFRKVLGGEKIQGNSEKSLGKLLEESLRKSPDVLKSKVIGKIPSSSEKSSEKVPCVKKKKNYSGGKSRTLKVLRKIPTTPPIFPVLLKSTPTGARGRGRGNRDPGRPTSRRPALRHAI